MSKSITNITETLTLESLTDEGVIICALITGKYGDDIITLGDTKTHYPNTITGRSKIEELKADNPNIYQAVMAMWGDEPVIDESIVEGVPDQ